MTIPHNATIKELMQWYQEMDTIIRLFQKTMKKLGNIAKVDEVYPAICPGRVLHLPEEYCQFSLKQTDNSFIVFEYNPINIVEFTTDRTVSPHRKEELYKTLQQNTRNALDIINGTY